MRFKNRCDSEYFQAIPNTSDYIEIPIAIQSHHIEQQ